MKTLDVAIPVFLPAENRDWSEFAAIAQISEDGEILVKFQDEKASKKLLQMAVKGILWQISIDYKMSAQMIKNLNEKYTKKIVSKVGDHPILVDKVVVGSASIMTNGQIELMLENDGQRYIIDTNQKADI